MTQTKNKLESRICKCCGKKYYEIPEVKNEICVVCESNNGKNKNRENK